MLLRWSKPSRPQIPNVADACPLCERPNYHPTDHHIVPKSRGGKVTETICRDCHRSIHAFFTNRELETTYSTVEALLGHPDFAKTVAYIAKQDGRVKIKKRRR
jgi:5-methylcytosine-specific restriction endonuclease McrA